MIVPERKKGIRSIRIPALLFKSFAFILVISLLGIGILAYDYIKILNQVYVNKHLTIENRQLKEQIQLFQMKINSLSQDIARIHIFEKKLRVITGLDETPLEDQSPLVRKLPIDKDEDAPPSSTQKDTSLRTPARDDKFRLDLDFENLSENPDYVQIKDLYEEKMAREFGLQTGYQITKNWSELTQRSFNLAQKYASFDFKFNKIKQVSSKLEVDINELDQYLLDKDSFIKSTPTILPTQGWVTSYYGPRKSPYTGRIKMHEGIDVGADAGTPIKAAADGVVTFSGTKPGFGMLVMIDHGYGIETVYGHNRRLLVKSGQRVQRGDHISKVGNTGRSTGPHLHYEVRVNGIAVDPLYFVLD
jgi:murein DD-endopeptidase MepM/ murein hydrolase activator NlpD